MHTCMMEVRVKIVSKSFLVHLLQADDVSIEAQQLLQDQGPAVVRVKEPTEGAQVLRRII